MARTTATMALAIFGVAAPPVAAAVIVNPSRPLTREVRVRLIQTAETDGSPAARALGDASRRDAIETQVGRIYAQAGIDVLIEPTIVRFNDTESYNGFSGTGRRPTGDVLTIFGRAASVLSPDPLTINVALVGHVPGFFPLRVGETSGASLQRLNGVTLGIGSSTRVDSVAGVLAHEIAHNLGLTHTANGTANLMSPGGTTDQMTFNQVTTILGSPFVRPLSPLTGDFSGDSVVNAADYSILRDNRGQPGFEGAYEAWKAAYGTTRASSAAPTPEPATLALVVAMCFAVSPRYRAR